MLTSAASEPSFSASAADGACISSRQSALIARERT
jgi:hypothetical protein